MNYDFAAVYIMANKPNGVIYIGVTNDLRRRVFEHRMSIFKGFTQLYKCKTLVWYEIDRYMPYLIEREKKIKGWVRKKKVELIESVNPEWRDLYGDLI